MNDESSETKKTEIVWLDPRTLEVADTRVTGDWDEDKWETFLENIRVNGILSPLLVADTGKGMIITDGLNRAQAAMILGIEKVPCIVEKKTYVESMTQNLFQNFLAGKTKHAEMIKLMSTLSTEAGESIENIAKMTGFGVDRIKKFLQIAQGDPYILQRLDEGKIGVGQAIAISSLPVGDAAVRVTDMTIEMKWTQKQTEDFVVGVKRDLEKPPEERKPLDQIQPRGIVCTCCGEEYPADEIKNPNICQGCLGTFMAVTLQGRDKLQRRAPPPGGGAGV
jgi:ParB-like chromosome segregation protein Spo0J